MGKWRRNKNNRSAQKRERQRRGRIRESIIRMRGVKGGREGKLFYENKTDIMCSGIKRIETIY